MIDNKQFKEWLFEKMNEFGRCNYGESSFKLLPFQFKWGVYLEFFDSVGIKIIIGRQWWNGQWKFYIDSKQTHLEFGDRLTRQEAQQEAIKKAFEILNK